MLDLAGDAPVLVTRDRDEYGVRLRHEDVRAALDVAGLPHPFASEPDRPVSGAARWDGTSWAPAVGVPGLVVAGVVDDEHLLSEADIALGEVAEGESDREALAALLASVRGASGSRRRSRPPCAWSPTRTTKNSTPSPTPTWPPARWISTPLPEERVGLRPPPLRPLRARLGPGGSAGQRRCIASVCAPVPGRPGRIGAWRTHRCRSMPSSSMPPTRPARRVLVRAAGPAGRGPHGPLRVAATGRRPGSGLPADHRAQVGQEPHALRHHLSRSRVRAGAGRAARRAQTGAVRRRRFPGDGGPRGQRVLHHPEGSVELDDEGRAHYLD